MNLLLCCPFCKSSLVKLKCDTCDRQFDENKNIIKLITNYSVNNNLKTTEAYKFYSRFYSYIALLTYWIIWRGNLLKHIAFFRELLSHDSKNIILDIATGEGSLTHIALLKKRNYSKTHIIAVDISEAMLLKAQLKLKDSASFVQADVEHLPFLDQSFDTIACFGGLNSFAQGAQALRELKRVLKTGGRIRGSFLLMPELSWKQKLVKRWIAQGYQTAELSLAIFDTWVNDAGLKKSIIQRYGDVILFELR
jgi:ubiquinone/menaquinone biosynthesis C-methylase UbiE